MSRVPEELAVRVLDEAETSGLTASDWIATVLAEKVGFDLQPQTANNAQGPVGSDNTVQEEFEMRTAS